MSVELPATVDMTVIETEPGLKGATVSNVTSSTPNGTYATGALISIQVVYSETVVVTGTPRLTLNSGAVVNYSSGSGTNTLTFSYTVLAGQNTSDLTISSFDLNGATVTDGAGNNANLSGATNYNPSGTLQIDTTAPSISSACRFSGGWVSRG